MRQNRLSHIDVQRALKKSLDVFLSKYNIEGVAGRENMIDPPTKSGHRVADVTLSIAGAEFNGFAFEVKTRTSAYTQRKAIGQLTDYLAGEYKPILVAPGKVYEASGSGSVSSLEHYTPLINVKILEVVSADPIRFVFKQDSKFATSDLERFFSQPMGPVDFEESVEEN